MTSACSALRLTVSPHVGPTVVMLTSLTFDARVRRRALARRPAAGWSAASSSVTVTFWPSTVTVASAWPASAHRRLDLLLRDGVTSGRPAERERAAAVLVADELHVGGFERRP